MKNNLWKLVTVVSVLTMLVPVLALAGCPSRRYAARCREERSEK
jgi:hypothetical protein